MLNNLRKIRNENKLTQQDLAIKIGVTQRYIAQMQADGADLFSEEIKNLQIKIANAKTVVVTVEQSIIQKYGTFAAHAVEIVFLAVILYKVF